MYGLFIFLEPAIFYARVSGSDQRRDLARQIERLQAYASSHMWDATVLSDLGSGFKINKRGLQKLLHELMHGRVERVVVTQRDRLIRFGFELINFVCQRFGTEDIILDEAKEKTFEEELTADSIEILTFSSRVHGRRSQAHRKKVA